MLNVTIKCVDLITHFDIVLNTLPRLRNPEITFKIFERNKNSFL